jgi:hypothetical protein
MMSVSAKVDHARSPRERPFLDRPIPDPAIVVLMEEGHVCEGLWGQTLEHWSGNVRKSVDLFLQEIFLQ